MSTILDTHVHLYPCYDVAKFFEHTWSNLERLLPGATKVIVLTERASERYFERAYISKTLGGGTLSETEEPVSLILDLSRHRSLIIISGKQYLSSEGIEVLALGARTALPDRQPIRELIIGIQTTDAIPVVPWSFGKWTFQRKEIVTQLIKDTSLDFVIGDIFGRPLMCGADIFNSSNLEGSRMVIFGTDPLPMRGEEVRSGSLCTTFRTTIDEKKPFASLKTLIKHEVPCSAGVHQSFATALIRQLQLRL